MVVFYQYIVSHIYSGVLISIAIFSVYFLIKKWTQIERFSLIWILYFVTLLFPFDFFTSYFKEPKIISIVKIISEPINKLPLKITAGLPEYNLLFYIWFLGALSSLLFLVVFPIVRSIKLGIYLRKCKSLELPEVLRFLPVQILSGSQFNSPFVYGFFSSRVCIPESCLEKLNFDELEGIIWHEIKHIHSKDNLILLLARVCMSVYWFFPPVYVAFYLLKKSQELAADHFALSRMKKSSKSLYAQMLIKISDLTQHDSSFALAHFFNNKHLTGRLKMIKNYKGSLWRSLIAPIGMVFLCSAVAFAATTKPKGSGTLYDIKIVIIENDQILSQPKIIAKDGTQAMIEVANEGGFSYRLELTPERISDQEVRITGIYCTQLRDQSLSESEQAKAKKCLNDKKMMLEAVLNKEFEMTMNETTFRFLIN